MQTSILIRFSVYFLFYQTVTLNKFCEIPKFSNKSQEFNCLNFHESCVKKDDYHCDNFLHICAQCPPTNYSLRIMTDIRNIIVQLDNITKFTNNQEENSGKLNIKIANVTNAIVQINTETIEKQDTWKIILILVPLEILLSCVILEDKFQIINKLKRKILRKKRNGTYYETICYENQNTNEIDPDSVFRRLLQMNELIQNQNFELQLRENIEMLEKLSDSTPYFKEFKFNQEKLRKLNINSNDNIVQIKKKIYSQLPNTKYNDYKIMRLKYNGNILDDNRYLLPYITDGNIAVECEIDHSINDQEIVIIKLEGNIDIPQFLQIHRNKTIRDLRRIISMFTDNFDYLIVKESNIKEDESQNIKSEILKDELTIEECQFTKWEFVKVIEREKIQFIIKSLFEKDELPINCSNTNLVSDISKQCSDKFGSEPNDFLIFLGRTPLNGEKYIFDYNINNSSKLKFFCLKNTLQKGDLVDSGHLSKLYRAKDSTTSKNILIIKYNSDVSKDINRNVFFQNLVTYQNEEIENNFLRIVNVFKDKKNNLKIAMENMEGGTLKCFLEQNKNISENEISKWSRQIAEGFKYLCDTNVLHFYIKPYDILVDEKRNIKLYSYYLFKHWLSNQFNKVRQNAEEGSLTAYIAPEVRNNPSNQTHGGSSLVWSYGVILINVVNSKCPNLDLKDINKGKLTYSLREGASDSLSDLIYSCVKIDPEQRLTFDEILQHPFVKSYPIE